MQLEGQQLVVDMSVLINLIASDNIVQLLAELNTEMLLPKQVYQELKKHPKDGSDCKPLINSLISENLLKPLDMTPNILELYLDLTTELDDGEAAVIAHTLTQTGCTAVIDEKKARRIGLERFNLSPILSTVDLLQAYFSITQCDQKAFQELLFNTLKIGRMRVSKQEDIIWVTDILGPELIRQCPSLRRRK